MKIVCILGSPHGVQGNTYRLTSHVLEGAIANGASVELVHLDGSNVKPCLGCDSCHQTGNCPQIDKFPAIHQVIQDADGVILASPNYIFNVSAQMKSFMDRCSGIIHCLSFEGKYGLAVVTSGGGEDESIIEYMSRFLLVTGIRPVGGIHATMATFPDGKFSDELIAQARDLGSHLVQHWREGGTDPATEQALAAFRNRMRQLIIWRQHDWPYEYSYWQEHHGLSH